LPSRREIDFSVFSPDEKKPLQKRHWGLMIYYME